MPVLRLTTNSPAEDKSALAKQASSLVAEILGKPESYVMVNVNTEADLVFAGTDEPCAHLTLESLGLPEAETKALSQSLCGFVEQQLGVPASRTYIEFVSPERHMFGWNNSTF